MSGASISARHRCTVWSISTYPTRKLSRKCSGWLPLPFAGVVEHGGAMRYRSKYIHYMKILPCKLIIRIVIKLWTKSSRDERSTSSIKRPPQMLQRYLDSPVLMSFNSNPRPITEIPFPAVTICNMNKETFRFYCTPTEILEMNWRDLARARFYKYSQFTASGTGLVGR